MKYLKFIALILFLTTYNYSQAQTSRQIKNAFTGANKVKEIVYYCKNRKKYKRKVKKLLRRLDRLNIEYGFKCSFVQVKKIENIEFIYNNFKHYVKRK